MKKNVMTKLLWNAAVNTWSAWHAADNMLRNRQFFFHETEQQFQSRWVTVLSPLSCHASSSSSSSVWALLPTSNPDVWELLRLTTELEHFSPCRWPSSSIEAISVEMLCCRASASIPELLVECRDRPGLLSEPWWSMSRSSLMYDSL